MYQSISDDTENNIKPYFRLNSSVKQFEEHMKLLSINKYRSISIDDLRFSFENTFNEIKVL
jgi:hypothetical protein